MILRLPDTVLFSNTAPAGMSILDNFLNVDADIGNLMVHDPQVARYSLVLQHSTCWYVDSLPMVGNDDHCASKAHTSAECHIPRHSQVVQFNQVWYRTKSF